MPEIVMTEDSNSDFQFYNEICVEKGITCFSANGKSNIFSQIIENPVYLHENNRNKILKIYR